MKRTMKRMTALLLALAMSLSLLWGNVWAADLPEEEQTTSAGEMEQEEPHTHTYGEPEWAWNQSHGATAGFFCTSGDGEQQQIEATVTKTVKKATYEAEGTIVYTAQVVFQGKTYQTSETETLPKLKKKKNTITVESDKFSRTVSSKEQSFQLGVKASSGANSLSYQSNNKNITVKKGTVTIRKNFVGKAVIVIKAKADGYQSAQKKVAVIVKPSKTKLSKVRGVNGQKITVKWNKNGTGSGYEIQCSTDASFKKNVAKKKIDKNSTTSAAFSKLTSGKTYYVRIRTVKGDLTSGWSEKKSVKLASAKTAKNKKEKSASSTVYTTDTGNKYHRDGCSCLRKSKHKTTRASAKARGYTPCKVCKPG